MRKNTSTTDGPPSPGLPPLPANLREISSLASWTVSSSKPGCSVPQLRSSDIQQFWQSDGPQPHLLNIHFFKQVSIVGVRLYLDFEADESYTPTHIQFLAGTGYNDLQQWADMRFEQPKGWIDVDFANVGRDEPLTDSEGDDDDEDDEEDEEGFSSANSTSSSPRRRRHRRRRHIPVLRAYLLQIKILENHQNGKDTHLRGVQIFARDKSRYDVDGSGEATPIVEEQKPTVAQAGGSGPSAMAERKGKRIALMPEWAKIPELR